MQSTFQSGREIILKLIYFSEGKYANFLRLSLTHGDVFSCALVMHTMQSLNYGKLCAANFLEVFSSVLVVYPPPKCEVQTEGKRLQIKRV